MDALDPDTASAWQQVADLRVQLQPGIESYQHCYRGQTWFVLSSDSDGACFRCSASAFQLLELLDGERTVQQACDLLAEQSETPPAPADVIRLLAALQEEQLLRGPDEAATESRAVSGKPGWLQALLRPLAVKIPLCDPNRFLTRALPLVKPLFKRGFGLLWLILVVWAGLTAIAHQQGLVEHWDSRFLDPGNLLWFWLLYPLVKGLHELGHGLVTRYWGGQVHEMGIILLVFMPVPYVDASASSAFTSKWQRMLVAGAGILVELLLAALAMLVWVNVEPGLLRDLSFNIAFIAGVSSLLFNGNPLLRFDAYFVLADAIEIPNLAARSNQYLGYLIKRYWFGLSHQRSPVLAQGEAGWLFCYGILSGLYRLFLSFVIALFVAGKFFIVGLLLALTVLVGQLLLPFFRSLTKVIRVAKQQGQQLRAALVIMLLGVGVGLLLFVMPTSHSTRAEGVVSLAEETRVTAGVEGFIEQVLVADGQQVKAGQILIQLNNRQLAARALQLTAQAQELQARYQQALSTDRVATEAIRARLAVLEQERDDITAELQGLTLKSKSDGIFAISRQADLPGRFIERGQLLGHVVTGEGVTVEVAVPQQRVDQVRRHTSAVEVVLASEPGEVLRGQLLREQPQATTQLPNAALGSLRGGDIAVDARDQDGKTAVNPVFFFAVGLPPRAAGAYIGQSVRVRFEHPGKPLAIQWYQLFRQLLLQRLGF